MCSYCERAIETAPWHGHGYRVRERCQRRHEMELRHAAIRDARRNARIPAPAVPDETPTRGEVLRFVAGFVICCAAFAAAWVVLP